MKVTFEYGRCFDRCPLKGVGEVDGRRFYKGREYWHVRPVIWSGGSPLPRWIQADPSIVLNRDTHAFPAQVS